MRESNKHQRIDYAYHNINKQHYNFLSLYKIRQTMHFECIYKRTVLKINVRRENIYAQPSVGIGPEFEASRYSTPRPLRATYDPTGTGVNEEDDDGGERDLDDQIDDVQQAGDPLAQPRLQKQPISTLQHSILNNNNKNNRPNGSF